MDRGVTFVVRSHRRLIVALLALALGATLGVAPPQAFAGAGDPPLPVLPKITLKVSPASSSPNKVVAVTGDVYPVERVGELAVLWVQKKSPSGKWKAAADGESRVLLTTPPPKSWMGAFDMSYDVTGDVTGTLGSWKGNVLYELDETQPDPSFHYATYTLTSALGVMTANYSFEGGRTEEYLGYSGTDDGVLRWYFAGIEEDWLDIQADSYEGSAHHRTNGVLTVTEDGKSTEYEDFNDTSGAMREGSEPLPQLEGQDMVGNPKRDTSGGGETTHEELKWRLAPSDVVVPYEKRHGAYKWTFTPKKTGFYRLQAMMPKDVHAPNQKWLKSGWIKLRVR